MADTYTEQKKRGPKPGVKVTYIAGDGDPAEVTWNGLKFMANVPRPVSNPNMVELA